MRHRKLEVWRLADDLVAKTFQFVEREVPRFHQNEIGSQLRRSIVSVKANIVEGSGRQHYQNDYLRFLIIARASLDESVDHIHTISRVYNPSAEEVEELAELSTHLGKKLTLLIQSIYRSSQ